jgi:DNA-binding MarR family transcriptional regulator
MRFPAGNTATATAEDRSNVRYTQRVIHRNRSIDPLAENRKQWEQQGWHDAALPLTVIASVYRAQQIFAASLAEALRPMNLTFARFEILALLSRTATGGLPIRKIGHYLQVHETSVTGTVNQLEKAGYVKRLRHTDDGRIVVATITDLGRAAIAKATPVLNDAAISVVDLPRSEQEELFRILQEFRRKAGDFESSG